MSELKPCPVCGSYARVTTVMPTYEIMVIGCSNIGCPMAVGTTLGAWQTRPIEDKLQTRIAQLEDVLKRANDIIALWECEGSLADGERELADILAFDKWKE